MNSISDTEEYKSICRSSVEDDKIFNKFKIDPNYNFILEHVGEDLGRLYLDNIISNFPDYKNYIEKFKKNDYYGSPKLSFYDEVGNISPTTLRYIKVLSDLKNIFGDLNGKKIIEIGAGYGGQCFIINQLFDIKEYSILDLDEASFLCSKYLKKLNTNHRIIKIEEVDKIDEDFDIVISNYAYSEINKNLQNLYYDKIISKSTNGYFTLNFFSHWFGIESYNKEEVLSMFTNKKLKIFEEEPKTFEDNIIIYF